MKIVDQIEKEGAEVHPASSLIHEAELSSDFNLGSKKASRKKQFSGSVSPVTLRRESYAGRTQTTIGSATRATQNSKGDLLDPLLLRPP